MESIEKAAVEFVRPRNSEQKTRTPNLVNLTIEKINSINLSGDQFDEKVELAGVYCDGVQYYDLKNLKFINNTGLANLIEVLKSLLKQGVSLRLVNVNRVVQKKIHSVGLENLLVCYK